MRCLLCNSSDVTDFYHSTHHHFLRCTACESVFRDPNTFLSPREEKERYEQHHNDVEDPGYQKFVNPIVSAVMSELPAGTLGLDYGAGTGPVISKLLSEAGYRMNLFDPFFHKNQELLDEQYDFIVSCEVIEHFHRPLTEFQRLFKLLQPGGKLYCMTDPLTPGSFRKWYYKDDPTHVIFYMRENLKWIKAAIGFSEMSLEGRLITFRK